MKGWFYTCFKYFMRFVLKLYFKRIKIEGIENVPRDMPLLVTPNHQNAFLDPVIVGAFIPLTLHFLTRADVFNRWTTPIMKLVNMMPIYRIRDGYSKLSLNDAVFETCKEIFKERKSILIFAEGNHGEHHYLRPLTKGAARIALQSQQEVAEDLMVLPVGINFFDHQSPQSSVLLVFGKPIAIKNYTQNANKQEAIVLNEIREAISEGMKSTLVLPENTEDYEFRRNAIFKEENAHLSFQELRDIEILDPKKRKRKKHRIARILNPLPYYLIRKKIAKTEDVVFHSTIKFVQGLIMFPLWWCLIFFLLYFLVGIHIAGLAVGVMIMGLFYSYQS